MKAIQVSYEAGGHTVTIEKGAVEEDWAAICERFDDDVHRIKGVNDQGKFTALYECFDDDSRRFHYLVEEDARLYRLKRKHFLTSLGRKV